MQQFQSLKGRGITLLLFFTFLWYMSFTTRSILAPILPFVEDEFRISHARASSVFIPLSIGYAVSLFLSGAYLKLFGPRKSIIISLALSAFGCLSIPLFTVFESLYVSTFITGLAGGIYLPAMIPFLTSYYSERTWGKVISIHDSGAGIGLFATPLIATALLHFFEWRGIFLGVALTMLACAVIFAGVAEETQTRVDKRRYFSGHLWKRREVWFLAVVGTCVGGATMGLYLITPLYLVKEVGMAPGEANTVLGLSRIGGVIVAISTGYVVDRFSPRKIMFALAFCGGLATMFLVTKDEMWIKTLFFVQACFTMGFMPVMFFCVSKLFDEEERGQATAILLTVSLVFGGMIPYLLGFTADLVSFRLGIFLLGAITMVTSGLVLLLKKLS